MLLNQALLGPKVVLKPPLALQLGGLWGREPCLIQCHNPSTLRQGLVRAGLSKRSRAQGLAQVGKQTTSTSGVPDTLLDPWLGSSQPLLGPRYSRAIPEDLGLLFLPGYPSLLLLHLVLLLPEGKGDEEITEGHVSDNSF